MSETLADPNARQTCDALVDEMRALAGENADAVEAMVRDTFALYFTASQRKREDPALASVKIAKMVAKQARKQFGLEKPAPEPEPEPAAEADADAPATGQVLGKTTGVDRKILNILTEVSAHYGTPITVMSGQRSKRNQVAAIYANWYSHLRNGKDNRFLAANEKLRAQLDELKRDKNKAKFTELLTKQADWAQLSRHVDGSEVDLAANTDPNIIAAIALCLNH
ncbi:MAG: hypothetical protein VXW58_01610, partial [Pseudomonadota bacterium]|nr:hypothetical protein [Pseudomonadota bacterium]